MLTETTALSLETMTRDDLARRVRDLEELQRAWVNVMARRVRQIEGYQTAVNDLGLLLSQALTAVGQEVMRVHDIVQAGLRSVEADLAALEADGPTETGEQ